MKIWRKAVMFYLGGCLYVGLELLWRGRSHWSMFLAGGGCFVILGQLRGRFIALKGAAVITLAELVTGLLVNRDYRVWDYRNEPGNFLGQICPLFCLLWIPLGMAATRLYRKVARLLP